MNILTTEHAKILYLRFCAIYSDKFVKPYHDEDFKSLWASEWSSGLSGIDTNFIKDSIEYCKKNLPWPPSISEFRGVCEQSSGVPTLDQVVELATRREFKHPVVFIAYEIVGSWSMRNDKELDLKNKFKSAYTEALNQFRENNCETWKRLEEFNKKNTLELPAPSKTPAPHESKAFRECMNKCQETLKSKKIMGGGKTYKHFDENKIKKGHREFDKAVFDEYRSYLLSVPEIETMTLPVSYAYARMRFLSQIDGSIHLKECGYNPTPQGQGKESPRRSGEPQKVYKNWNGD